MSKRIDFMVTDEFYDQIELVCELNSSHKNDWIRGLIQNEMAIFFRNYRQEETRKELDKEERAMRKSWALDNRSSGGNRKEIGITHVFPTAY